MRDSLLGITPKDLDIVIQHLSIEDLEKALNDLGIKYDLVGKSFGIIKAKFLEGVVDLALPRKEISTGEGHRDFLVQYDPDISLSDDAKRRDFTINAIYKNVLTLETVDSLLGELHLKESSLVPTSLTTFRDDPLRILRAIQFCSRFNLSLVLKDSTDFYDNVHKLTALSGERISLELGKLMLSDKPSIGLFLALNLRVLESVLPELSILNTVDQPAKFHNANAFAHTLRVVDHVRPDINLRFAALFHDLGKATTKIMHEGRLAFHGHELESKRIAQEIINRLKLTCIANFDPNKVLTLIENHMYDRHYVHASAVRRLVRRVGGIDMFHELVQLKVADVLGGGHPYKVGGQLDYLHHVCTIMNKTPAKSSQDLAVDGHDIMQEFSIPAGPLVGKILSIMFEGVEEDLVKNDYDSLILWFENLIMNGG